MADYTGVKPSTTGEGSGIRTAQAGTGTDRTSPDEYVFVVNRTD
jgi:hypothetical protein